MKCIVTFFMLLSSCVTSVDHGVELNLKPNEDSDYYPAYTKSTRQADVLRNFEMIQKISATYLSPDFLSALTVRTKRLFAKDFMPLQDVAGRMAFFVVIFSPEYRSVDLSNPDHWNLMLDQGKGAIPPASVKKISDKQRWAPFFETINHWTSEYLVIFQSPTLNAPADSLNFTFASGESRVKMTW